MGPRRDAVTASAGPFCYSGHMSRAFVKEPDGGAAEEPLPERRISEHPNYVTPAGLEQLKRALGELTERRGELLGKPDDPAAQEELRHVDRELRYYEARLDSAIPVDPTGQPRDQVAFGATVTVTEESAREASAGQGETRRYAIVGEEEADADAGSVSYVSPLAKALLGARVGQSVTWRRPAGDLRLTVQHIAYGE